MCVAPTRSAQHFQQDNMTTQVFRVAKQNRIFQDVVAQIQDAIIRGQLQAGDKLPAERELKETLQTSRSTLREALRVLEQKGLLEIKRGTGGGAVVKAVSSEQVTESLDLMIKSQKVSLNHLAEFREGVEGDVVALAAEHADEADITLLKRLTAEAGAYVDMGVDHVNKFLDADKKLHMAFAKIAENPLYISILKTIQDNMISYYKKYLPMGQPELEENLEDLVKIVKAVEAHQPNQARKLAKEHIRRFNAYMTRQE